MRRTGTPETARSRPGPGNRRSPISTARGQSRRPARPARATPRPRSRSDARQTPESAIENPCRSRCDGPPDQPPPPTIGRRCQRHRQHLSPVHGLRLPQKELHSLAAPVACRAPSGRETEEILDRKRRAATRQRAAVVHHRAVQHQRPGCGEAPGRPIAPPSAASGPRFAATIAPTSAAAPQARSGGCARTVPNAPEKGRPGRRRTGDDPDRQRQHGRRHAQRHPPRLPRRRRTVPPHLPQRPIRNVGASGGPAIVRRFSGEGGAFRIMCPWGEPETRAAAILGAVLCAGVVRLVRSVATRPDPARA